LLGFLSLVERKLFALCHLRCGPNFLMFGFLTPLFDGVKLFLKFFFFVFCVDLCLFVFSFFCFLLFLFFSWFFLPFGFFVFCDVSFSLFCVLFLHFFCNFLGLFFLGFLFNSVFVYFSVLRLLFFGLLL
jgi:NADH:ubiquinone oxidoreductase subunit H